MHAIHVIKRPLVSEKATADMELGRYVFEVDPRASKTQIRIAIKELYQGDAVKVNTSIHQGRTRLYKYGKVEGTISKKATVRLKDGQRIELF